MDAYKTAALKELTDQQVRYAPPARRLEQLNRAEQLLTEIDPARQYPYPFVCFRITGYRPKAHGDLLIAGAELRQDLYQVVNDLLKSLKAMPPEEVSEPVVTLEQLSRQLNVSPKTVRRWRKKGLVGARPILCNGKRHVGFVTSMVDRFLAAHADKVERGSRFSQITSAEREDIVRRAVRLARVGGGSLMEISQRIARRLGRSTEAIRYTLKNFDRTYPDRALFPNRTGPLDSGAKEVIYSSYKRGIPVHTLAKRFQRTRNSMYRVINEVRAQHLLERPLDYIYHPSFDDPSQTEEILAPMPQLEVFEAKRQEMRVPKDVPPELSSLYETPLLTKDQEQHLFRKMNYLKHRASQLRNVLDPSRARIQDVKAIEDLQEDANGIKDLLINANMRLVVSIAKKHSGQTENFFELLSDGNMSLIRAVEKFDFGRGFKFSTYASWAIMKNFARSIPEERHRRERYVTTTDEFFEAAPDSRTDEQEVLATAQQAAHRVNRLLEYLDPRERDIIRMRAGLDDNTKAMTLEEIGRRLGITKERVRQLNVRIMNKLRNIARDQKMDMS